MLKVQKNSGWITAEVIAFVALIIIIGGALAVSLKDTARFNKLQLVKQQCIAAASAQLDSITATDKPIEEARFDRLWPAVTFEIERTPGKGDFEQLEMVTVTAAAKAGKRQVNINLSRYLKPERKL